MTKDAFQRSVMESLMVTYGDFDSAYADLHEQFEEAVVNEKTARRWVESISREIKKDEAKRQLTLVIAGGEGLDTRAVRFREATTEAKLQTLDHEFLAFAHSLIADHRHEIFEPKERVTGIPKIAELLGTPVRLQQSKRNTPQQAHQDVPAIASVFGMLTDRQVMTFWVMDGGDAERLTNTLRTMDPETLGTLSESTVTGKLREWQRRGVVMDSLGTVEPWDIAIDLIRHRLKTLPGR